MLRRTFVKASGMLGGLETTLLSELSERSRPASPEVLIGQTKFVEAKLEHPAAPEHARIQRHGKAGYVVENDLYLTDAPTAPFEGEYVVTEGHSHSSEPDSFEFGPSKYTTAVHRDFRHLGGEYVLLESAYDWPRVNVAFTGSVLDATVHSTSLRVKPGETKTVALPETTIEVSKPSEDGSTQSEDDSDVVSKNVVPELSLRNHGTVNVFGTNEGSVFPGKPTSTYAKNRLGAARAHSGREVTKVTATSASDTAVNLVTRGEGQ